MPVRGDEHPLVAAVPQLMAQELRAGDTLRVVPPEKLSEAGLDPRDSVQKLAAGLGTQLVLFSELRVRGEFLKLDLTLRDGVSGKIIDTVAVALCPWPSEIG